MNLELYINNRLVDIESPEKLGIRLKRVFINPAELNTKDAQKSYEISLPATPANNEIFNHVNVEEVQGKFKIYGDARLYVDGVLILDGKFRLSEITRDYYKGNLGVPAKKTAKDIFGEAKMNEAGEWLLPFESFPEAINEYNRQENPDCIFPYVLYGLLPKKKNNNTNQYSSKIEWDNTVSIALDDFPPSINCLEVIRNIFKWKKYDISGSAYSDEKLKKLYMSYKNPTNYELPWNHRGLINLDIDIEHSIGTEKYYRNEEKNVVNYNLIPSRGITINENKGNMFGNTGIGGISSGRYEDYTITIPLSGVYEIALSAELELDNGNDWPTTFYKLENNLYMIPANDFESAKKNAFEIKVLKYTDDNFIPTSIEIDRKFGKPNIYQNNEEWEAETQFPKYFPQPNKTMLIDPSQNEQFIVGIGCGKDDLPEEAKTYYTPAPNSMVLANGWTWNPEYKQTEENYITSHIEGYLKATLEENIIKISESSFNQRDIKEFSPLNRTSYIGNNKLQGTAKAYVYLNKGEKLTIVSSSTTTKERIASLITIDAIRAHTIKANLKVRPVSYNPNFVNTMTDASEEYIDKNSDILKEKINLIKFLPSDQKIDDWLDNFCKAFNLQLTQTSDTLFELNTKQNRKLQHILPAVDLDDKTHVDISRKNESLNLPSVYELGFKTDKEEEGYIATGEDGAGIYYTGNTEGNTLKQDSTFSYTWFKDITYKGTDGDKILPLPVITKHEIWQRDGTNDYEEMMQKADTNLAQRFWYKGDNFPLPINRKTLEFALVKNKLDNVIELDYHNEPQSILSEYFSLFLTSDMDYTIVECRLTADEYNKLIYSYVKFNGDLYYCAEIDGYDPLGKNKASLKLIRKTI